MDRLEEANKMGELYKSGQTIMQIADRFICNPQTVCNRLDSIGIKRVYNGRGGTLHYNWKGGKNRYLSEQAQRALNMNSTAGQCSRCNMQSNKCVVHHIDKDRHNNIATNLVVLCYSCHKQVHQGGINSARNSTNK